MAIAHKGELKINRNKIKIRNRIGSVMASVLALSAIDCGYEPGSCQSKEYKIGICCFSAKNTALKGNFAKKIFICFS